MDEKEPIRKLIEKISEILGEEEKENVQPVKESSDGEWTEKSLRYLKKYGHLN
jgi:hypothetical protein